MKIAVIGAGSWGTALAQLLAKGGHEAQLWARDQRVVDGVMLSHRNPRYLIDADLDDKVSATLSYDEALHGAQAVVVATPSAVLRDTGRQLAGRIEGSLPVVACSKGVEKDTGLLPIEVLAAEIGGEDRCAVLSGPNHAEEIVEGIPAATVIASSSPATAAFFQHAFASDSFRVYVSDDAVGVELCAAFKNVIAIAVGLSYGLGYGDNTAAMLMTRGQAEMSRLVVACGGAPLTCMGLAGTGDLIATCMSQHSRNRRLGEMIAAGRSLKDFTVETHMVAEGAYACCTLATLAERHGVELPITDIVRSIVWEGADVSDAARILMSRPLKSEGYGL